jgi:sugar phosphate isomerase/epimerase
MLHHIGLSRRDLLHRTFAGVAAGAFLPELLADPGYKPFKFGLQSYTLRNFDTDQALEKTHKLGLEYWEAYQKHVPKTTDASKASEALAKLRAAGIRLYSWGVEGFDGDEAKARQVFEFAKLHGVKVISADPTPAAFPVLDKLTEEYKINIAIHNHGPGARYDKIDSVLRAIDGHSPRIGACVDTGHYLRSSEDPVAAVKAFGKRVYGVHVKDVKDAKTFTVLGKGDLNVVGLFRELLALKFSHLVALEYEENPQDPMADVDLCLAASKDAIAKAKRKA